MADQVFKNKCISLRRQGLTLGQIQSITNRPKTSIYFHIADLELDQRAKEKIKATSLQRLIAFNHAQLGKSRLGRNFRKFETWTPQFVNLVSHLIFDGEIRKRKCAYSNRSHALIDQFKKLMKSIYKFKPHIRFREKTGVITISYFNVALTDYLKIKAAELLKEIEHLPQEPQRAFLQSFFDDEGSVSFLGKRRQVHGYQHTPEILEIVRKLLANFTIESKIDYKYHEIIISRKENLIKFEKEINFSKGLYINPNRTNSIWKKPLEKREILRRAIESYTT